MLFAKHSKPDHLSVGKRGEDVAARFYKKLHFRILERNYRASRYEIDLIAADRHTLAFVEVKARSYTDPDAPDAQRPSKAINYDKKQFLIYAAKYYLRQHPKEKRNPRIDVVEVYFDDNPNVKKKKILKINHIPNAFGK